MELELLAERLSIAPASDAGCEYIDLLHEAEQALRTFESKGLFSQSTSLFSIFAGFSKVLNVAYNVYNDKSVLSDLSFQSEKQRLLKSIQDMQLILLNDSVIQKLADEAVPSNEIVDLVINYANIASNSDKIDLRTSLQAWRFMSKLLSVFHSQLENEFMNDLQDTEPYESYRCDQLLDSMINSIKTQFAASLSGVQSESTEKGAESQWKTQLKLVAFICRLVVGCLRQFPVALFATNAIGSSRSIVNYLVWTLEIQFAGGLFPQGTGLPDFFKKEVETSLFVATHVALSCVAITEPAEDQDVSVAAELLCASNIYPLVKSRIFIGILQGLAKHCDEDLFSAWLNDNFNIYTHLFNSLEEGLGEWRPYEKFSKLSNFCVPKLLHLSDDNVNLSTSVEEFLTDISIQLCQTVRILPKGSFSYLENALLNAVLHSSPIIDLVAQDVWCFIARYGNADLCWQYVILLSNTIICLAERFEVDFGTRPPKAPLGQLTRLGNLLSRFIIFLSVRQQREYLTNFPLFDRLSYGATDKSVVWRFLTIRLGQFQSAISPLIEQQLLERINFLLSQPQSVKWMLDTLICLRLAQDLPAATLASNSSPLSQLVSTALTSEVDCSSSTFLIAPPHILHLIDLPMRTEAIVSCLAAWFPRLLQFAVTQGPGKCSDVNDESRQLMQLLLTELQSPCNGGCLSSLSMNAFARWILASIPPSEGKSLSSSYKAIPPHTPVPLFNLISRISPLKPIASPPRWLSPMWFSLAQTEHLKSSSLTGWAAENLKKKLSELLPDIDKTRSSALLGMVDECLNSLSTTLLRLEENVSSCQLTSEQSARGIELSDRLAALFCKFD